MTQLAHASRGRCCGSGCRHCPYAHARVPADARAAKIARPAWLVPPDIGRNFGGGGGGGACVLFWSTGKDSFLALRALRAQWPLSGAQVWRGEASPNSNVVAADDGGACSTNSDIDSVLSLDIDPARVVLLTTFDATSRMIAHQETQIADAVAQARALCAPLLGVPLHRGGPEYSAIIRDALEFVRSELIQQSVQDAGSRRGGGNGVVEGPHHFPLTLAFGDLHLGHVRQWREAAQLHSNAHGDALAFPLWNVPYETLLRELRESGVSAEVSAVTESGAGIVETGETFDEAVYSRALAAGIDGFGENGEFHTLVRVADHVAVQQQSA